VQNERVDVVSAARQDRHPLRLAGLIALGVVAVAAAAALAVFLWLRTYAPLDALQSGYAPGPGLAADVQPVLGSGGKPVLIPQYRPGRTFDTAFTLHNTGRFAVEILGMQQEQTQPPRASQLFATDSVRVSRQHPFERFRLNPDDTASLVVRWKLACTRNQGYSSSDSVVLRYRYLSQFERTERITLPFAVTLRCGS
jgi:hypothetical protein